MRTRSTLLSFAAVVCLGLIDAHAQKATMMARPATRRAIAPGQVGDPLTKMDRTDRGISLLRPLAEVSATGRQRAVHALPVFSTGKPAAGSNLPSLLRGAAPVNDNCANATLLTVGTACVATNGTVDQATQSLIAIDCATFVGNANDDVWYRFVAPGANVTVFLECNEFFDGVIDLRSGACNGTNIDCMDNFIAGGSETLLATGLTAGTTYRFRVYDYEAGYPADPTFSVCVYATPDAPANDLCEDADIQSLSVPGAVSVNGDNTGATDTEGFGVASAWEAFTITACADVTISYCGTDPIFTNAFIGVEVGCPTTETIVSEDFDATSCGDDNLTVRYTDLPAGTYYYPVLTEAGSVGPYTIEFSAVACGGGGSTPPNDECFNVVASSLAAGTSVFFDGTTENATNTNDGAGVDAGGDTVTVWHAFTTTECTDIAVAYCGTPVLPAVYWAALFEGCPADDAGILFSSGNFDDCADGNATIFFTGVPAGTYYLPVRGEPASWGDYTIEVSATACADPGPYCDAGATSAAFETISNVTFAGIDNSSDAGADYQDFTQVTGIVVLGQSYPIEITVDGGFATDQALVWIDFDQSETFEPTELAFTSLIGVGPYTGSIAVPAGAALGSTRMRVRLHDTHDGSDYQNTPNDTPCDTSTYGQVEDYAIVVTGGGPAPENDNCGDVTASDLSVGSSITFEGDNTGATIAADYVVGSDLEAEGLASVWHSFTTTECANVVVAYCGTTPAFLNGWVVLSPDCPAGNDLLFNTSFNNTDCGNDNLTVYYNNLPAGTWYMPVMMDPSTLNLAMGPYTIEVSATACSPGPPNDECTGAISLDVNLTCEPVQGTVTDATQSLIAITCNGFLGAANDDVWYSFIATGPNQTITVDGTDTLDAVIELFQGPCNDLTSLDCADATLGGAVEEIVTTDLVEGTTYYVRVYDWYTGYPIEPTFDICVIGDVGTAVAEEQEGAFTLRPNPSEGQITIDLAGVTGRVRVDILDVAGRSVQSEQRQGAVNSITFDLSPGVNAGIYTVRLTTEQVRCEQRLLVK